MPRGPNERRILDAAGRIAAVADELAQAFAERAGGDDDVLSAGYLLGSGAAAQWARHFADAGRLGLRIVDRAEVRRFGDLATRGEGSGAGPIVVDDIVPGAALVEVLFAARAGLTPKLVLGPRSAPYAGAIQRAIGDLIEGDVTTTTDVPESDKSVSFVVVAPYYWDKRDMDRVVRHLALEVLAPPPGTTRVEFLIAGGWEQHKTLWPRVLERIEKVDAQARPRFEVEIPDVGTALETLRAAREAIETHRPARASLHVHPMWREGAAAKKELATMAAHDALVSLSVGHRAALPWALGAGGYGQRARVDVSAPAPSVPSPKAAKRRVLFAARPSLVRAAQLAVTARL
ncbi:MAG: hypothetical protein HOV80_15445 [Polyangiaceae bacterium]|nr:hypothetical protein [Polyangiaceae bacterium]